MWQVFGTLRCISFDKQISYVDQIDEEMVEFGHFYKRFSLTFVKLLYFVCLCLLLLCMLSYKFFIFLTLWSWFCWKRIVWALRSWYVLIWWLNFYFCLLLNYYSFIIDGLVLVVIGDCKFTYFIENLIHDWHFNNVFILFGWFHIFSYKFCDF